jgi:hypothetical protein
MESSMEQIIYAIAYIIQPRKSFWKEYSPAAFGRLKTAVL